MAAASTSGAVPRLHERALRLVPRGLYLSEAPAAAAYTNEALTLPGANIPVEAPHIDVLILQKLRLVPGQRFLEIGSGSGYLTMLAAYLVGASGQATGVDLSKDAVTASSRMADNLMATGRFGDRVKAPRFLQRDGGSMLDAAETWHAVCVSGNVQPVWTKTLRKLLTPRGRLVVCSEGKLRLFEQGGPKGVTATVIGDFAFPPMALSRRLRRSDGGSAPAMKRSNSHGPRALGKLPNGRQANGTSADKAASPTAPNGTSPEEGLALRVPERGLIAGGEEPAPTDEDDAAMADVMREVEMEEMSGLLVAAGDVEICRTPKGRKCRLGEGGFGVVYKALMNGVDEVAVKLVKVRPLLRHTGSRGRGCCWSSA